MQPSIIAITLMDNNSTRKTSSVSLEDSKATKTWEGSKISSVISSVDLFNSKIKKEVTNTTTLP